MKTMVMVALLAIGCAVDGGACRDPESIELVATSRESTCDPPFETREGMLHCEQLDSHTDHESCEFRGSAVCTNGIQATLRMSFPPGEAATGTATYRREADGCEVVASLREKR